MANALKYTPPEGILKKWFEIWKRIWLPLAGIFILAYVAFVFFFLIDAIIGALSQSSFIFVLGLLIALIFLLVVMTALFTMNYQAAINAYLGRKLDWVEMWRESVRKFFKILAITVILALISFAITIIMIIPFLGWIVGFVLMAWVMTSFSLTYPVLLFENRGVIESLERSWNLVKGAWWEVFGYILLVAIMVFAVAFIEGLIEGVLIGRFLGLSFFITQAFIPIIHTVLYFERKKDHGETLPPEVV